MNESDLTALFLPVRRAPGGESYFRRADCDALIQTAAENNLAVLGVEGFYWDGKHIQPSCEFVFDASREVACYPNRDAANAAARKFVSSLPNDNSIVVAFVLLDSSGKTFVP